MPILTIKNANIQFVEKKLIWGFYTTAKALSTTKRVELINKKELAKPVFDKNSETFVVYVASLKLAPEIHLDKAAQIVFLLAKKVRILDNYLDFTDVFSEKKVLVLPKCTKLNEHAINLEDDK